MKQIWTFFVAGLFMVAVVSVLLQNTRAEGDDPRVVKIKDPSITALKTEVPNSAELDSALVKKEKELNEKAEQMKLAEDKLKAEEERIKYKIEELEKLQADLSQADANSKQYSETVFKKLIKTFETMDPKKAAAVISSSEDKMAVDLFLGMKEKKVAAIMEVMDPARATAISTLMAKRKPAGEMAGNAALGTPK